MTTYLFFRPSIHGNRADETDMDTERTVNTRAVKTDEDTKRNGSPLRVLRIAITTNLIKKKKFS